MAQGCAALPKFKLNPVLWRVCSAPHTELFTGQIEMPGGKSNRLAGVASQAVLMIGPLRVRGPAPGLALRTDGLGGRAALHFNAVATRGAGLAHGHFLVRTSGLLASPALGAGNALAVRHGGL